jgi:hypothetical protein
MPQLGLSSSPTIEGSEAMPTRNEEGPITLTSDEVLDFALDTLLKGVKLYINGYKCTAQNVYEAANPASIGQPL